MTIIRKIPWHTGGGNIIITYSGHGCGVVTVSTDSDTQEYREQTLTIRSSRGLTAQVVVRQVSGTFLCDKNGYVLNAQWHQLTVTPTEHHAILQAKGSTLRDKNGKRLRTSEV